MNRSKELQHSCARAVAGECATRGRGHGRSGRGSGAGGRLPLGLLGLVRRRRRAARHQRGGGLGAPRLVVAGLAALPPLAALPATRALVAASRTASSLRHRLGHGRHRPRSRSFTFHGRLVQPMTSVYYTYLDVVV